MQEMSELKAWIMDWTKTHHFIEDAYAMIELAEEEKDELIEVVDFLKNPKKYRDL